jgi:hypothetical protein
LGSCDLLRLDKVWPVGEVLISIDCQEPTVLLAGQPEEDSKQYS